jgi:hypothetical protein
LADSGQALLLMQNSIVRAQKIGATPNKGAPALKWVIFAAVARNLIDFLIKKFSIPKMLWCRSKRRRLLDCVLNAR